MAKFKFGKFFGNTLSTAGGTAAGIATAAALTPLIQEEINLAWQTFPNRPVGAGELAGGVAQGQVDPAAAKAEAALSGISGSAFDTLVNIANTGPPLGPAMDAFRRGVLDSDQYQIALNREGIEPEWWQALLALKETKLSLSDIGNGVQQGHLPGDDILPPEVTGGTPFDIPLTQIDIDPIQEAAAWGIDEDRLKVITNLSGLPPGDIELLQMWNRGIITEAAVEAGIREGHRKTKWIPAVKELRKAVLSATQYVDARVRGWIDDGAMYDGGALTGHSSDQMDLLFKNHGRPLSWHQIWIGLQRGGVYDGDVSDLDPAFLKGLQESDIRPEWYNLAWAQRYNYPSAFVLKSLVSGGDITSAEAEKVLLYEGWEPTFAKTVSAAWGSPTSSTAKPKTLTAAEVRAGEHKGAITHADALSRLEALGYSPADAAIYLTPSPAKP